MKVHPILFSGPMIRALLEGRKTMTRRVAKLLLPGDKDYINADTHEEWITKRAMQCPYGQARNLLWVRETFCPIDDRPFGGVQWIDYRATPKYEDCHPAGWENAPDDPEALKWKPSIFMPRTASRLTLELTGVRVERLSDLTDADAVAEGLAAVTKDGTLFKYGIPDRDGLPGTDNYGWPWDEWSVSPRGAYFRLWDKLNGPLACADNPWIWALSFTVHQVNIDAFIKSREIAA